VSGLVVQARIEERDIAFDLALADGEVLAVLGPNGAGKSSLLQLIAGLLRPDEGRVELGEHCLTDTARGVFVPPHARGVALLSQRAMLFPHMNVAANVAFAPRSKGKRRPQARAVAERWLRAVGAEHLANRRPGQLSGGQAQRVAVARALAADPEVLLLDEPMAALDVSAAPALRRLLREILRDEPRTAVLVTHDLRDALAVADQVIVLEHGRIVESGPVRLVLTSPRSAFAARITGVNLIPGTITAAGALQTAWGATVYGVGDTPPGTAAVALFRPTAVAIHPEQPHGSPRNVFPATVAEMDIHESTIRVRGAEQPDGGPGLAADITAAAATDLELAPGHNVYFVVKTQETELLPAHQTH